MVDTTDKTNGLEPNQLLMETKPNDISVTESFLSTAHASRVSSVFHVYKSSHGIKVNSSKYGYQQTLFSQMHLRKDKF